MSQDETHAIHSLVELPPLQEENRKIISEFAAKVARAGDDKVDDLAEAVEKSLKNSSAGLLKKGQNGFINVKTMVSSAVIIAAILCVLYLMTPKALADEHNRVKSLPQDNITENTQVIFGTNLVDEKLTQKPEEFCRMINNEKIIPKNNLTKINDYFSAITKIFELSDNSSYVDPLNNKNLKKINSSNEQIIEEKFSQ